MKSSFVYIGLFLAICISIFFTFERSFLSRDFEIINSEESEEVFEEDFVEDEQEAPDLDTNPNEEFSDPEDQS